MPAKTSVKSSSLFKKASAVCDEVLESLKTLPQYEFAIAEIVTIQDSCNRSSLTDVQTWAGVDLVEYIGVDISKELHTGFSIRRGVSGGIVFLPILWTWLCLALASSAFASWSSSHKGTNATPSFLDLWHTGFDGHLYRMFWFDRFTLGAVLISLLVMFVLVTDAGQSEDSAERNPDVALLARRLRRLEFLIRQASSVNAEDGFAILESAMNEFQGVLSSMGDLQGGFQTASSNLADAAASVENALNTLNSSTSSLAKTTSAIPAALDDVIATARQSMEELRLMNGHDRSANLLLADRLAQMIPNLRDLDLHVREEMNRQISRLDKMADSEAAARKNLTLEIPLLVSSLSKVVDDLRKR